VTGGDESAQYVPEHVAIGDDVMVPRAFTWRRQRPGDVGVEVDVVVEGGVVRYREVRIVATDDHPSVSADDLQRLPLALMLEDSIVFVADIVAPGRMPVLGRSADERMRAEAAARRMARRSDVSVRRPITDDRLRLAVETYRRVKEAGGTVRKAADHLGVKEAQMYRYLAQAKRKGIVAGGDDVEVSS
jgi:hypothetical protein